MKKVALSIVAVFLLAGILSAESLVDSKSSCVTYELSGGRFGDNVRAYALGKVVAEIAELPLLFRDFKYAHLLCAGHKETRSTLPHSRRLVRIKNERQAKKCAKNTMFSCRFDFHPLGMAHMKVLEYCAQHPAFGAHLRDMLKPIVPLKEISIPEGSLSVAVHIRVGSGGDKPLISEQYYTFDQYEYSIIDLAKGYPFFDKNYFITSWDQPYSDQNYPLKYPPCQYYVDQIKKIAEIFQNKTLFVCLFTDHECPAELVDQFNQQLKSNRILITCSQKDIPASEMSLLEDYYNISRFDCLIRSDSHFAVAAQFLGNHKLVVYPEETCWVTSKQLVVHKVGIMDNGGFEMCGNKA